MTSLKVIEFDYLLEEFERQCDLYFRHHTLRGKFRVHPMYEERKNSVLYGSEKKLFFLLTYMKNYPLQQFQSSIFNISQGKVSEWIKCLTPILETTLKKMKLTPTTNSNELKKELEKNNIEQANMDVTERDINRSIDDQVQKEFYSGKKKAYNKEQFSNPKRSIHFAPK